MAFNAYGPRFAIVVVADVSESSGGTARWLMRRSTADPTLPSSPAEIAVEIAVAQRLFSICRGELRG
ncbi:hypothetical protein U91I_02759 [alpha proteobacterium U9-1i]|nr:hypothetical protein U91I_02759 [alpha proteobacterium U9-1i]